MIFICGGGPPVPDTTSGCPRRDEHTPQPAGYVDRSAWAGAMLRAGAKQRRCPGCGLLVVWTAPARPVKWP